MADPASRKAKGYVGSDVPSSTCLFCKEEVLDPCLNTAAAVTCPIRAGGAPPRAGSAVAPSPQDQFWLAAAELCRALAAVLDGDEA